MGANGPGVVGGEVRGVVPGPSITCTSRLDSIGKRVEKGSQLKGGLIQASGIVPNVQDVVDRPGRNGQG